MFTAASLGSGRVGPSPMTSSQAAMRELFMIERINLLANAS